MNNQYQQGGMTGPYGQGAPQGRVPPQQQQQQQQQQQHRQGQGPPGMGMGMGMGPGGFAPPRQGGSGGPPPPPNMGPSGGYGGARPQERGANATRGLQWVNAFNGQIPPQAVQGGVESDGTPLFVARAMYKGGLHPGKAGPHIQDGGCAIGWGHKEVNVAEYQVLCGDASQLRWINQNKELVIQGFRPVDAGHEETGEPLYVAKALYQGSQQLGKCAPHIKHGMSFPYGHKERTTDKYMVLAYVN
ncbi:hypothetical protein LPJ64_003028 [Coemansia asiatica]|uniref:Uncharacterized protein n=1 Tax=Coemansia asiatica TaxID=1052880 RepID=A0A9W7XLW7_9FUNG|nr:hypothetical protein LPJ64_003028 [Coemansia asiatica]